MIRLLTLAACMALCGIGCVSEHQGTDAETSAWRIGETTPRDVVSQWGNPDFVRGDAWVWWNVDVIGGKFRASYMHLGVTLANSRRSFNGCRLTFSPTTGKLSKIEVFETLPGGGKWSLWPW